MPTSPEMPPCCLPPLQRLSELVPDLLKPANYKGAWPSEAELIHKLSTQSSTAAGAGTGQHLCSTEETHAAYIASKINCRQAVSLTYLKQYVLTALSHGVSVH